VRHIWQIRDFEDSDLDQAVHLWEASAVDSGAPIFRVAEVVAAVLAAEPALVAVVADQVIGTVVARVSGDRAWILRLAVDPAWRSKGVRTSLLEAINRELLERNVRQTTAVFPQAEVERQLFADHGFTVRPEVTYFERVLAARPAELSLLQDLGGRRIGPGLWQQLSGMEREKELVERRVILPLAKPALADHHGVTPPQAIILFGPPGTGKTTFAKGVASRLGWPFVELFPSRLGSSGHDGQANALREFFHRLAEIDSVVLFIDEVEEIAKSREDLPPTHAVTNPTRDLGAVRHRHHRGARRPGRPGRRKFALHPRRYRVRLVESGPVRLRARGVRRRGAPPPHRRLPTGHRRRAPLVDGRDRP
jgi:transitional endoplasmic reticulum ATPase